MITAATVVAGTVVSCSSDDPGTGLTETSEKSSTPLMMEANDLDTHIIDDDYRTCYEIFVRSFYDSDGDGIGDLNGVDRKLDYIGDMGFNMIWLMPVMPSTTYHKYDVTDYMSVDSEYGTVSDFQKLVDDCHTRDIKVIIDLVLNHTSSEHPWFKAAEAYLLDLAPYDDPDPAECRYVDYYNFSREQKSGYCPLGDSGWYYEAQFWSGMPDLNLSSDNVRDELSGIIGYWLSTGVDGFRLDAVTYYYTGSTDSNIEFLNWVSDTAKSYDPDVYIVGEAWTDISSYSQLYASGIDSFFDFDFAGQGGIIAKTVSGTTSGGASSYGEAVINAETLLGSVRENYIDAPFFTNHDVGRAAGFFAGDGADAKIKMAHAMNLFMGGTCFLYYGEELGMKGSGKDENKRLPMFWSEDADAEGMTLSPAGSDKVEMKYPSFEEQAGDPYSIFNFIKQAIKLRNIHPEIARGSSTLMEELSDERICVLRKDYDGSALYIIFNISENAEDVDISLLGNDLALAGMLQTSEDAPSVKTTEKGDIAVMPPYSVLLLK